MQHRKHLYELALEYEVHGIGKASQQGTADLSKDRFVSERCLRCPFYRGIELQNELDP